MYYMTYGNNDYRDYVMAHSLGEWKSRATKYIDKIIGPGGKVRYIYDTAKTGIQKHVTGSYYKRQASEAIRDYAKGSKNKMSSPEYNKQRRESMMTKVNAANAGYRKSLAGRLETARGHLTNLKFKARNKIGNLISRGKSLVARGIHAVKKRLGMYNDKHKSDADSYGRTNPSSKEELNKKYLKNSTKAKNHNNKKKSKRAPAYTY